MPNLPPLELPKKAVELRIDILKMLNAAGSGHSGGSLGMADIFTALYFHILHHDPENPEWADRDRLFLSNGHIVPVRYAAMAHAGYFPITKLKTLREFGSDLQGHPERTRMMSLESTSGPLGSGLGQAAGYAYAARMDNKRFRTYCITSDGEHDEGNHWESVMFAAKYKLGNLTVFVDRNNIQIDGFTHNVMPLESLSEKYKAFNWNVVSIDGHNFNQILSAVEQARSEYQRPTVIIAKTIPGKGVYFMENKFEWHGKVPDDAQTKEAVKILTKQLKEYE